MVQAVSIDRSDGWLGWYAAVFVVVVLVHRARGVSVGWG